MNLEALSAPFPAEDIEWRISRCGTSQAGPWAFVLAYVTNRAIMERLDRVCGPENWQNEFAAGPHGGVLCGISIACGAGGAWVTKWDGAENTDIEAVKGGLSGSMKRAGAQWGIGRYLYNLTENFATTSLQKTKGWKYQKANKPKNVPAFYWTPPELPDWALPQCDS